jgi:hypothetical protein
MFISSQRNLPQLQYCASKLRNFTDFENEKELLTRPVKIKPITLFFIDNIEEYPNLLAKSILRK